MATLTIDLNDPADVKYGLCQLNRMSNKHRARAEAEENQREWASLSGDEVKQQLGEKLEPMVRGLLNTKIGRRLIAPFIQNFSNDASIEEIAGIIEVREGVDPVRKAHSLVAGLGRWEGPRALKIFETLGGKPQRFRMNPLVREVAERVLREPVM